MDQGVTAVLITAMFAQQKTSAILLAKTDLDYQASRVLRNYVSAVETNVHHAQ